MTMGGVYISLLELLVILLSQQSDVNGNSQYSRVGDNVTLPCKNVVNPGNCSSTTWNYNRAGSQNTMEEVKLGTIKKGNDPDRSDRLSLGSDCSVHVSDVRAEDAGTYTCIQYPRENGPQQGVGESVYLSLLHISSSTPVTELKPDEKIKLRCSLHTYNGKCNSHLISDVIVNLYETGTVLEKDFRLNITNRPRCEITLNVTLQREENNRKWKCQLTIKEQVKTSIDFLATFSGSPSQNQIPMGVGVAVGVAVAVSVIAVVIIVHKRRSKNQMTADVSLVNNIDLGLNSINCSTPPAKEDRSQPAESITYGIAYATISHFNQNLPQRVNAHEDTVTYASVMTSTDQGRETENPADLCSLYSTVNKHQE